MQKHRTKKAVKPSYLKWGLAALVIYLCASLVTISGPFSFLAAPASVNQVVGGSSRGTSGGRNAGTVSKAPTTPITTTNGSGANNTTTRSTRTATITREKGTPDDTAGGNTTTTFQAGQAGASPTNDEKNVLQTVISTIGNALLGAGQQIVANNPEVVVSGLTGAAGGVVGALSDNGGNEQVRDRKLSACDRCIKEKGPTNCASICASGNKINQDNQGSTQNLTPTEPAPQLSHELCSGGNAPIREGDYAPTGYGLDKDGNVCRQAGCTSRQCAKCTRKADGSLGFVIQEKSCGQLYQADPAHVVLPSNPGAEYTSDEKSNGQNQVKNRENCIDSSGAPVPHTTTRQGEKEREYCNNGDWFTQGELNATCKDANGASSTYDPATGLCKTNAQTANQTPAITGHSQGEKQSSSKSVCYGEKLPGLVVRNALRLGENVVRGQDPITAIPYDVIAGTLDGVGIIINCSQKDNPSFEICRSPRYIDAKTNECRTPPTTFNENDQTETSQITTPQSSTTQSQPPKSNQPIFTDAPGIVNVDTVGRVSGCVTTAMLLTIPCGMAGVMFTPVGGAACYAAACYGGSYVGDKAGDVLYNVTTNILR